MSGFIPVNLSAIDAKRAQALVSQSMAEQVASKDRLVEDIEQGFNPIAAANQQARLTRFRTLDQRRRVVESKEHSIIEEVTKKSEEDLSHEFSRRNPELPADRLRDVKKGVTEAMSEQEIIDHVSKAFADPTLADEVFDYLNRTAPPQLQPKIRRARLLFNDQKRSSIVAGRNITPVARLFHGKGFGENPTELRNLYREVAGSYKDHNVLFSLLSQKYPFDDLQMAVAFLLQGLSYDLKSKGPSIQQAELILMMSEVRNLQSILWVYQYFKGRMKLIRSLFKKFGKKSGKTLQFEKLAQEFVKLVEERYPTVIKLLKQMDYFELDDLGKIIILSQYRDAIRELSPRVYKSTRHQQDLLMIILESLEDLEEKEEAREEE